MKIVAAAIIRKALNAKKLFCIPTIDPMIPHIIGPRKYPMPQKR